MHTLDTNALNAIIAGRTPYQMRDFIWRPETRTLQGETHEIDRSTNDADLAYLRVETKKKLRQWEVTVKRAEAIERSLNQYENRVLIALEEHMKQENEKTLEAWEPHPHNKYKLFMTDKKYIDIWIAIIFTDTIDWNMMENSEEYNKKIKKMHAMNL